MVDIEEGRNRVVIEGVSPRIDGGRFPAKRVLGDRVFVEADIFTDGHDVISARFYQRHAAKPEWAEASMHPLTNDRWRGEFEVSELGFYEVTLAAWVDHFLSWHRDLGRRLQSQQDLPVQLQIGAAMIAETAKRAPAEEGGRLNAMLERVLRGGDAMSVASWIADDTELVQLMDRHAERKFVTVLESVILIEVDRERAGFSSWYELFPRSTSPIPGKHGTFRDVEARLPYVASMGFDVLYLPPIHPIGENFRKGKNNAITAEAAEPGSPWAVGGAAGGHTVIHPELGTLEDFQSLVQSAHNHGIELALDVAFQVSPDHPMVRDHPGWFRKRPDGSVQYAENPPKKYQDIYPFDFESEDWVSLWHELRDIFLYWIDQGVRIFRVDNPHTKPLLFWEWVIGGIKSRHPDVLFLAEAFTRPKVMYNLAKAGFSQSYTYFTWRTSKEEITDYFTELTSSPVADFFRPNVWPNTPDILPENLQHGGRASFMTRLILAATLSSNYGIYGPAFELGEHRPRERGSEEYLDSEKYEIKAWNWEDPNSLRELISLVNRIRMENPALHSNRNLRFHPIANDQLICYSKTTSDFSNIIVMVVNLDPYNIQAGRLELPLEELQIPEDRYQVHDLLSGGRYSWHGGRNPITINPHVVPAQIYRIRRRVRMEHDFEYFL